MISTFVKRCLACNAGVLASYPFETMKVSVQTRKKVDMMAGFEAPLVFGSLSNGVRFQLFSTLKSFSYFWALVVAGSVQGFLEYPIQNIKLQRQINKKLYPGGQRIIYLKELIGTMVHFYLFNLLQETFPEGGFLSAMNGGFSAGIAMSVVYPLDVFYVNYKTKNMMIEDSIEQGELWVGYQLNLLKTMVGYSVTMFIQSQIIGGV